MPARYAPAGLVPALQAENLSKRFGGALALDGVSLAVERGEVHGLLGSNGSGKSTLIKILAGFHTPEPGGAVRLYSHPVPLPMTGAQARARGLAFVHQHLGLIPSLSVTENLFLGEISTGENWRIGWRALEERADAVFRRFDLALDPRAEVGRLSAVERALLAIVRAYDELTVGAGVHPDRPGVLVLDEPTPFLPRADVEQLFALMRACSATGASVVFVSHDIDEVRTITDRATVLRDGRLIGTVETELTDHADFVGLIVGRSLDAYGGARKLAPSGEVAARIDLTAPGLQRTAFEVHAGEIVGLAGLIGSGADRVPALLCGARPGASGTLDVALGSGDARLDLATVTPRSASQHGVAFLPADRLGEAGVGSLPVADNVAMPVYERLRTRLGLTDRAVHEHAGWLGADAGVKPNAPALPLSALSGGNAQKALVAKWLQTAPRLLLLDEPTQGVDVGARQAIWDALDRAAGADAAILVASTDAEQLAALCHRVLVFAGGAIRDELTGARLTKDAIAEATYDVTYDAMEAA